MRSRTIIRSICRDTKEKSLAFPNPYEIDITEIDGFDNLHHATGIIKEAEVRGAELYHSKRCFFSCKWKYLWIAGCHQSATRRGDKVLVARNCHKAVYHALYMNELQAEYLYPSITKKNGIQGQITAEQVQESLYENPDAVAVILTSPRRMRGLFQTWQRLQRCAMNMGFRLS